MSKASGLILVVFGLPGSGKSYFAAELAKALRATYFNTDIIRKTMSPLPGYSDREKSRIYNKLIGDIGRLPAKEELVIADGTFYKSKFRKLVKRELGARFRIKYIEVICPTEELRSRLQIKRPYSDADFEVYQQIKRAWEPMKGKHLVLVSGNDNLEDMIKKAMAYLLEDVR
jgi:predicted kinase